MIFIINPYIVAWQTKQNLNITSKVSLYFLTLHMRQLFNFPVEIKHFPQAENMTVLILKENFPVDMSGKFFPNKGPKQSVDIQQSHSVQNITAFTMHERPFYLRLKFLI